jgi:hypothetical protein
LESETGASHCSGGKLGKLEGAMGTKTTIEFDWADTVPSELADCPAVPIKRQTRRYTEDEVACEVQHVRRYFVDGEPVLDVLTKLERWTEKKP